MLQGVVFFVCKGCFGFTVQRLFFVFSCEKTLKTARRRSVLTQKKFKKQLIDSINISSFIEIEDSNEKAEKVDKPEDAAEIIKEYEKSFAQKGRASYLQRIIKAKFSTASKFMQMVGNLKIHRSTIIFKINIFKLIDKHPGLMKSSATLGVFKNYYKDIKQICEENSSEFG